MESNKSSTASAAVYYKENDFDKNSMDRILNLMRLKELCLVNNQRLVSHVLENTALHQPVVYNTFFSAMSNALDILLMFFINDEISASLNNRGPLGELLVGVLELNRKNDPSNLLKYAFEDVQKNFCERVDFLIGSALLDFVVATYSNFELWIEKIYDSIVDVQGKENLRLTSFVKYFEECKINKDFVADKNALLFILKEYGSYVSGSEKIEYVLARADLRYKRNKTFDLDVIKFYQALRNTIHNGGVNKKNNSMSITVRGVEIRLPKNMPSSTDDRNSYIYLCEELVEIYQSIIDSTDGATAHCCVALNESLV